MKDLVRIRGVGAYTHSESGLEFARPDNSRDAPEYRFVKGDEAEYLESTGYFQKAPADRLEAILDGTAAEAAEKIEAGHADDILDLVRFAEREGDDRSTVTDAIEKRREVSTQ